MTEVIKIGFIGGGNMAEAIIKGMVEGGRWSILVSEPREERRRHLEQRYGVKTLYSSGEIVSSCNIIVLAIKPQDMETVLDEIGGLVTEEKAVVSIAAGITLSYLSTRLKTRRLIRVMPNTPALVQEGMTVLSLCECFPDRDISLVREIFMSIGKVIILPEKYMDVVTALSGSGPAFIALFAEAMIEAGIRRGLGSDVAETLTIQTLLGTARLLESGIAPKRLREMVTSPGGTTAAGLEVFEKKGLMDIIITAIEAATKRAEELGRR